MYRLLFDERSLHEPFVTREPLVFIGRQADCTLRLTGGGVSNRHAVIERRDDGYHIRDLGTPSGVRVNGLLVGDQRLASGDEVEIGSVGMRFEIVQQSMGTRRTIDWLQTLAAAVIAGTIFAQVALLYWLFTEPRPRKVRLDSGRLPPKTSAANAPAPAAPAGGTNLPLTPLASAAPAAPTAPATPPVLNRMIKIQRADRKDATDGTTLQLRVVAQVGERTLDPASIAIAVQFVGPRDTKTFWMSVPRDWENFGYKTFAARWSGVPAQLRGYIVRTYYRKQLQDVVSVPTELAATMPPLAAP